MDLQALRQTASHLLAAALFETFPEVDLWQAETTDTGFVSECFFPHPVHADTLALLEQKMKEIAQEARPIRILEMVPVSASALLKKEGHEEQSCLLDEMQEEGALVEVVQMGSFHQLTKGPCLKNSRELQAFKLLSIEILPEKGLRVEGTACASKEELKNFLKKLKSFKEENYQVIGARIGFWKCFPEGVVWLSKGLSAKKKLANLFFEDKPFLECSDFSDALLLRLEKDFCHIANFCTNDLRQSLTSVQQVIFYPEEDFSKKLNSSLHSIYKILIMLGFDCWVQAPGKRRLGKELKEIQGLRIEKGDEDRIDWMIEDSLMRPCRIASVRELKNPREKKNAFLVEAFIERILVLMLEKNLRTTFLLTETEPR